ncbi:MAG: hypothetical protein AAF575_05005 [Bacteroidota bacterium]
MKTSKTTSLLLSLGTLFLLGCSSDDNGTSGLDCNGLIWVDRVADEADAFVAASIAFSQNPSAITCNAANAAARDYLDALEEVRECVPGSERAQFQRLLDENMDAIADIDCSNTSNF